MASVTIKGEGTYKLLIILSAALFFSACHSSKKTASSKPEKEVKEAPRVSRKERENKVEIAIKTAYTFSGTPYRIGGMDKKGIDCSGLIKVSYKNAGIDLPRTTSELCNIGNTVKSAHVEKGDLLFFATNKKKSGQINHVGIVTKVEKDDDIVFIHASLRKGVMENRLSDKYYKETFVKAIRPF